MPSKSVTILFMALTLISWSPQIDSVGGADSSTSSTEDRDALARTVNEFGFNLLKKLMKQNGNDNIVISPSGIAGLLAMTLLGSAGSTYDELATALGFSQDILVNRQHHEVFGKLLQELNIDPSASKNKSTSIAEGDIQGSVNSSVPIVNSNITVDVNASEPEDLRTRTLYADAIVVDLNTKIRDLYSDYLKRVYRGEAFITNFEDTMETQQLINDWVKNHTSAKIEKFLQEPLPVHTRVVLLSALYFSGQWARPFVPEYTKQMTFHTPTGDVLADLMLNAGEFNYVFKQQYGVHMIALPYNDSSTTMYVLQPAYPKKSNLSELLGKLDYTTINELVTNMTPHECVLRFPKMDLKTKVNLKDSLKELGVHSMFSRNANFALMADIAVNDSLYNKTEEMELLSRIYLGDEESNKLKDAVNKLPNPGVFVDAVLHDVKITVNEYGTVAVAATSGLLSRTAKLFYVNSPVYIFIRNEQTKLITFSAVINDPTQS